MRQLWEIARGCIAFLVIALGAIFWCVTLYVIGIAKLITPFHFMKPILGGWMDAMITGFTATNAVLIKVLRVTRFTINCPEGMSNRKAWAVIASNHQSWADIIVLQTVLLRHLPPIKFFTKRELIKVPFIGLAMWLLRFPYVLRFSKEEGATNPELFESNKQAMSRTAETLTERPVSLLMFLEGTRFTPEKRARQESPFTNLLKPKIGGLGFALDSLQANISCMWDCTIIYEDSAPGFWDFWCGRCRNVYVEISAVPVDENFKTDLKNSVHEWWQNKNERISELRRAPPFR